MNIFEYTGLLADHRASSNKVTQFVKHYDEVVDKHKNKTFAVQVKKDGVCALTVIVDGAVKIFSRTGKLFTNTEIIVERIKRLELRDGVYMGEMWVPKHACSIEQLSGAVNPNRVNPLSLLMSRLPYDLQMSFFDLVSLHSFRKGHSDSEYRVRSRNLAERFCSSRGDKFGLEVLPYELITGELDINAFLDRQIDLGEEGIVIRDPLADWEAGHKGWRVMKKVRGVDYDLLCVGVEEGTGKYKGRAANLIFKWKDKTIKCMLGKGWTHDDAAYFFTNPPLGCIFQVYALEESSKGKLRLPKVGERRFDKEECDG